MTAKLSALKNKASSFKRIEIFFLAVDKIRLLLQSKIFFSCSGIIIKIQNNSLYSQRNKSGIFRSVQPNFISHNKNVNVVELNEIFHFLTFSML